MSHIAEAVERPLYGRYVPFIALCARIARTLPDVTGTSGHARYSHQIDTDDDDLVDR